MSHKIPWEHQSSIVDLSNIDKMTKNFSCENITKVPWEHQSRLIDCKCAKKAYFGTSFFINNWVMQRYLICTWSWCIGVFIKILDGVNVTGMGHLMMTSSSSCSLPRPNCNWATWALSNFQLSQKCLSSLPDTIRPVFRLTNRCSPPTVSIDVK